ncbi:hypothetical protein BC628DRAFT_1027608 [Trametes gibbosa]|nr:hypothetical protein BC628DRAFT_1027608 [Trametes gibbosa]
MTEYTTDFGALVFLVPAPYRLQVPGPAQAQANGGQANTQANAGQAQPQVQAQAQAPAQAQAQAPAPAQDINDENVENVPTPHHRRRRTLRSVRELRRRSHAINPNAERQPRFRRVMGEMNGQQVVDLREYTLGELNGETYGRREYIDLRNGTFPSAEILQDTYSFPSAWSTFQNDA